METKLNALERIRLFELLPKEGNFATIKVLRQLKEKLSISEAEQKEFNWVEVPLENGAISYKWGIKGKEEKPFKFTDQEESLIKKGLKDLDSKSLLTESHESVCIKFNIE